MRVSSARLELVFLMLLTQNWFSRLTVGSQTLTFEPPHADVQLSLEDMLFLKVLWNQAPMYRVTAGWPVNGGLCVVLRTRKNLGHIWNGVNWGESQVTETLSSFGTIVYFVRVLYHFAGYLFGLHPQTAGWYSVIGKAHCTVLNGYGCPLIDKSLEMLTDPEVWYISCTTFR